MKAIRNAITIGSGCGKRAIRDNPSPMLASVVAKVRIRSMVGTDARSAACFAFCFSNQSLKPEDEDGFRAGFSAFGFGPLNLIFHFNDVDLKPYFTKLFLKFVVKKAMNTGKKDEGTVTDKAILDMEEKEAAGEVDVAESVETKEVEKVEVVVEKIEGIVEPLKPKLQILPKHALICIGEYPVKVLVKGQFPSQKDDVQPVFIDKSSEEIIKWSKDVLDADAVSGLDANVETNFWFQILPYLAQNEDLVARLKNKLVDNQYGALLLASSWDGVGSALLPTLISRLNEWSIKSIALSILPSKLQPSDAHFNALSSMGMCVSKDPATLILVGRDQLNKYVGVDRNGSVMKGNMVLNCLVEMMLTKKTFVRELSEMSRSFGVKTYTVLVATGASFKIYGSLENILDTTLFRPLLAFDLSGASLLYVLLRIPLHLKEKLSRDKIELAIAQWFKEKATLESIYVTDPIYVEEGNDRVDVVMFVGGFDLREMSTLMEKKVNAIKTQAVKQGSIKEEDWEEIMKSLAVS